MDFISSHTSRDEILTYMSVCERYVKLSLTYLTNSPSTRVIG